MFIRASSLVAKHTGDRLWDRACSRWACAFVVMANSSSERPIGIGGHSIYDGDLNPAIAKLRLITDVTEPDRLRPFKQGAGKPILLHGWSDFGISAEYTRRYHEGRCDGETRRACCVEAFVRLFLPPGVGHCRGGTGA